MKTMMMIAMMMFAVTANAQTANGLFDNYSYEVASAAHAQAPLMNEARALELVGNFRMIATASRSYKGEFQKKDQRGIANQDASVLGLQIFAQSTGNLVQVIQQNLGKAAQNQGPSVFVFKPEGTAVFSQFSYKNGQVSDAVFFFSECKLLIDQSLLCAKRFMVQDLTQVNPQQAAMNNTIVGFDLYVRQ